MMNKNTISNTLNPSFSSSSIRGNRNSEHRFWRLGAILLLWFLIPQVSGILGCSGDNRPDLMIFPSIVAVDSVNGRIFVIDNEGNRLNLIEAADLQVFTKGKDQPLVSDEDPVLFQAFPSNGAVTDLGGGTSRIFIIGGNAAPNQEVTVLDYSGGDLPVPAPYSPITVPAASTQDILVGLAIDPIRQYLLVTNASTGLLHVFDINTGAEVAGSPIVLAGVPTHLAVDSTIGLAAVANSSTSQISFIDLTDLTAVPETLDVGLTSRAVALSSNAAGSLLFVTGSQMNVALVYQLNFANLAASTLSFQQNPTVPTAPRPDPELLTGNLNFIAAGNLTDGQVGAYFPQSTGDLFLIDVAGDLSSINPVVILIGAVSGEGVDTLLNGAGQVTQVYFASPGVGALTVIDPLENALIDQIP